MTSRCKASLVFHRVSGTPSVIIFWRGRGWESKFSIPKKNINSITPRMLNPLKEQGAFHGLLITVPLSGTGGQIEA